MSGADAASLKERAARAAADVVQDGMRVGLGTGSTAAFAVQALGERVAAGLRIVGVATSEATAAQARGLGIPLAELDEVDLSRFVVIKGFGGALLREKLVARSTKHQIIIVDAGKLAADGLSKVVPVEIVPFGARHTAAALERLGGRAVPRERDGAPFVTDGGNLIFDCDFGALGDPAALGAAIKAVPGVVEHGLFIDLVHRVIVATATAIETYRR